MSKKASLLFFIFIFAIGFAAFGYNVQAQTASDSYFSTYCVVGDNGEKKWDEKTWDRALEAKQKFEDQGYSVKIYRKARSLTRGNMFCDDLTRSLIKDENFGELQEGDVDVIDVTNENFRCKLKPITYQGTPTVWLQTKRCTKRPFKSSKMFTTYFDSWDKVENMSKSKVMNIKDDKAGFVPFGPKAKEQGLMKGGALVKIPSDNRVYLLLGDKKYWITKENIFNELNYKWGWIQDISPQLLDKYESAGEINFTDHHPVNSLIKYPDSNKVYKLERDASKGIVKRHITDEEVFTQLGYRFDRVVTVDKDETYPDGSKITAEGKEVVDSSSSSDTTKEKSYNFDDLNIKKVNDNYTSEVTQYCLVYADGNKEAYDLKASVEAYQKQAEMETKIFERPCWGIMVEKKDDSKSSTQKDNKETESNKVSIDAEGPKGLFKTAKEAYKNKNWEKFFKTYTAEERVKQIMTAYNANKFTIGFAGSDMVEMIKNSEDLTEEEKKAANKAQEATEKLKKEWNNVLAKYGLDKFSDKDTSSNDSNMTELEEHVKSLSYREKANLFGKLQYFSNELNKINSDKTSKFHNTFTGTLVDVSSIGDNKVSLNIEGTKFDKKAMKKDGKWYWYVPRMEKQEDGSYSL